jgi:hypothetical protein
MVASPSSVQQSADFMVAMKNHDGQRYIRTLSSGRIHETWCPTFYLNLTRSIVCYSWWSPSNFFYPNTWTINGTHMLFHQKDEGHDEHCLWWVMNYTESVIRLVTAILACLNGIRVFHVTNKEKYLEWHVLLNLTWLENYRNLSQVCVWIHEKQRVSNVRDLDTSFRSNFDILHDWWCAISGAHTTRRKGLTSLQLLTAWELWNERNARVFQMSLQCPHSLFVTLRVVPPFGELPELNIWAHWCRESRLLFPEPRSFVT